MIERVCSSSYNYVSYIDIPGKMTPVSIRPSFNTFSVIDLSIVIRRLSITVIELNWRLKILFDMYDQRQSLLIVNIVIYLIKTIKDILIEEKMIHF